jgi:hypothetical protein
MTPTTPHFALRILFAFGVVVIGCSLCSCGKQRPTSVISHKKQVQDPELVMEGHIQSLMGEINTKLAEVNKLIRAAGPELTPETRNKGLAARHKSYLPEEYVNTLRAGQVALRSKFDTFAFGVPAFEALRHTNTFPANPTIGHTTNAAPDELIEESKLKVRLIEVKQLEEEMVIQGESAQNTPADGQLQAGSGRPEPYSPEDYETTLRVTVDMLERKVEGLEAEANFYRNLLGLDSDDVPIQKR